MKRATLRPMWRNCGSVTANGLYIRVASITECPIENDLIVGDADEMIVAPLQPKPCNRQVLDALLGAIEQHRRAVTTLRARKLQQRGLAWRLWGIEYDEIIPIDAPEEPDWAMMAADIEAAEQEKRELTAVVERIPALLTYFTHLVDAGVTPIVCGRDRQKLRRWKTHARRPL